MPCNDKEQPKSSSPSLAKSVVCIGDLHGNINKIKNLWANLQDQLGEDGLKKATVNTFEQNKHTEYAPSM